jgi:hypothetical protein
MWKIALICQPHKKGIMKKINWKKILPHVIAVAIFFVVALFYCKPALEGKVLQQSDITQWKAMSQNQRVFQEQHGEVPMWTNGMFSGMPGYMIMGKANMYVPGYFTQIITLGLPKPFQFFFMACVCFYFLSQVLKIRSWVGVAGALFYAYASYNAIIVAEGHDTKMISLALLPGLIASIMLIYEKKYWAGTALTALFTAALISQNHYQIAYYGLLIIAFMSLAYIIKWVKQQEFRHLFIALALAVAAGGLGAMNVAVSVLPNYEYTKESIRGGSILASDKTKNTKDGLSEEYAFSYSVYKSEPFVMMVPRMFGGSNKMEVAEEKSKAVEALQGMNQQVARELQNNLGFYWGGIGGTSGPPYVGAIVCFLALLGFVMLDGKHKWWILALSVLSIMMSWGSFFPGFNNFLFKHLPMYDKFRAPSMILVIPTLLLNIMAILSLQKILATEDKTLLFAQFKKGLMVTGGLFVVLLFLYFSFDYKSAGDTNLMKQIAAIPDANAQAVYMEAGKSLVNGLVQDRKGLFMGDMLRSLLFILVAGAAIWLSIKKKIQDWILIAVIALFSFIDIMMIDVKYLSSENYQEKDDYDNTFTPTAADQFILKDTSADYRVFDVSGGPQGAINYNAKTSYFHQNVGGYHPAKLSIYQDLAENQLYNYPNCKPVLDMLNTKYIIHSTTRADQVEPNPDACGSAWFIKALKTVNTPKEEMDALTTLHVKDTAVIGKGFEGIASTAFSFDSTAKIYLVKKENDMVSYKSKASSPQFAVFSEVYYNKGWNAYIDGKLTPHAKVNYVLRGMPIPAGEHEVVFKFEPKSHALGWTLTSISTWLIILLTLVAAFFTWKQCKARA